MSSTEGGRPSTWNSAGALDRNWERKSAEMRGAFEKSGKGEEKSIGAADEGRAGDKATAQHDREPSQADLKKGMALDTRNASREQYDRICEANARRNKSRGMDLSR